jgi:MFS family permease
MNTLAWSAAILIAPLMSGAVIDHFGPEWLWGLCAVVGTLAGIGFGVLMRRLSEELTPATAVPDEAGPEVRRA